ncbi:hypothetical protein I5677_04140 [Mobilitalea sibirica]|uniref:Uncharacterized protein n=1 Tax=Mobilitalea sibirica TaxID=1462919 RepID=A0A8J7H895_9FIRM|nr:DUF5721 family protein [Mobilitalea sibirica]MBH1940085.1 hypothetical protein [Mobilitalea sibirica]
MISVKISEVKNFMAKLLTNSVFDHLLLREMDVQTFTGFQISGQLNDAFFSSEELEERGNQKYILWGEVRGIAYSMIKGSKTPLSLKIVFQLPPQYTEELVQKLAGRFRNEDIGGLYMNIRFEKGGLHIITGTAIKTFTMDKSLEQEWDHMVKEFLKKQEIAFEEET